MISSRYHMFLGSNDFTDTRLVPQHKPICRYWYRTLVVDQPDISGIFLVYPCVNWEKKKENDHENFHSLHKFGFWYFRCCRIC